MRHSRAFEGLMRWVQVRNRSRDAYEVRALASDQLDTTLDDAWDRTLQEIDDIRSTSATHGIPLLLVIAPYRFQMADPQGTRQPQDRLLAFAREKGVECVDLLPVLADRDRVLPMFDDESHFSIDGHRLVAERLAEPLLRALSR